jgi:NADPH:quinone reductase-like Zn-dependent oxidoreductase
MRAVVHDRYGPPEVLHVEDVERPSPAEDEVLVRIHATTVNRTDCHARRAKPFLWRFYTGLLRPKRRILGMELAGTVEAVGAMVTDFAVGDRVFGFKGSGANAEFVCVRGSGLLAHMPAGATFEQAAAVCDGAYQGLAALRRARVGKGTSLLVYGASGSCGTAAVQLARYLGAHVTAVCNTKNVELVRSLGADEVVDYTQQDFTQNGETYDVILDAVDKTSFRHCRRSLQPDGLYVATDLGRLWQNPLLALWTSRVGRKKVVFGVTRPLREDLLLFKELVEGGEYRAVIDRCYPLEDVVEATLYVETQQKTGSVVLTVA